MQLQRVGDVAPVTMQQAGSLTQLLRARCDDIIIRPLAEGQRPGQRYFRESLLLSDDRVLIWAYSRLRSQQRQTIDRFCHLRGGSLGEKLLFVEPSIQRSPLQFYTVDQLPEQYAELAAGRPLYGRYSRFCWPQQSLSLFEVFFPEAHRVLACR
ncbi:hypothetical protein EDC56_2219 [Sinobacterium caligoides]|uniref:Chorismate lyase n=1 Tax=Sinobacterium caligoides TaxID=933926 RepID=A0A3N2DPM3_9GAMM|nr:hypothetical protein [Sinobacterium caligoides]ROS01774.1 hypothetical protein EDC56_2219 [Sinobacterium caligoides]